MRSDEMTNGSPRNIVHTSQGDAPDSPSPPLPSSFELEASGLECILTRLEAHHKQLPPQGPLHWMYFAFD